MSQVREVNLITGIETARDYTPEELAAIAAQTNPVPQVVTPRQARLALLGAGLLNIVNAAVATADAQAQIDWDYALEIRRDNALIASIAEQLNLTEQDVDNLFRTAAAIQ